MKCVVFGRRSSYALRPFVVVIIIIAATAVAMLHSVYGQRMATIQLTTTRQMSLRPLRTHNNIEMNTFNIKSCAYMGRDSKATRLSFISICALNFCTTIYADPRVFSFSLLLLGYSARACAHVCNYPLGQTTNISLFFCISPMRVCWMSVGAEFFLLFICIT